MSRTNHAARTARRLPSATPGRHGSTRTTLRGLIAQGRLEELDDLHITSIRAPRPKG